MQAILNMSKKKLTKKTKSIEESLWDSANKLRGSVEPSEYKHVVLALLFLKFASDKFEGQRQKLINEGLDKYLEKPEFYNQNNIFFLDIISRWDFVVKNSKQNDISLKIDTALHNIEKKNKSLKGALPDNYFSRLSLDITKLSSLIDTINGIDTLKDEGYDIVGRVYEFFLKKFAILESSGKGKGEFYTPKSIVNLIAELIEPFNGIIYDPACGTGGMFIQSVKFIENHNGNKKEVSIYGQESIPTTYKLAKMNLAIRGISADLGHKASDTFSEDLHKDLKADYIMANPPFNLKDWRAENELRDDPRWMGYDVPPKSNANYAWILNIVSKLSQNGTAGLILSNGALGAGGEEYKIRKSLIKNNLIEAILVLPRDMFYNTDISVSLWIINKNKEEKKYSLGTQNYHLRNRQTEILFIDLRRWGSIYEKKYIEFTTTDLHKIVKNFHNWRDINYLKKYKNVPEYCYSASLEQIEKNNFSLVPSKYIEFVDRDSKINFDEEMKRIKGEFKNILEEELKSQDELKNALKKIGYEL